MSDSFNVETAEQVADVIRWAAGEEQPLELVSGGTKCGFGHTAAQDTAVRQVDLSGLSGITLYEPEELVVTVKSGTPLSDLEHALEANKQHLAFEPPDYGPLYGIPEGGATVGGIVSCNLSGPRRMVAGAVRDHVLGLSCVSGRGEDFKCGGRVVKNVTGYDLCKLLTGSYGTLAAMTEISLRVVPAPERTVTALVFGLEESSAVAAMGAALSSQIEVSAASHAPKGFENEHTQSVTALRLEGPGPSVDARLRMLGAVTPLSGQKKTILDDEASHKFWQRIRDVSVFTERPDVALWRLSSPPAQSAQVVEKISEKLDAHWFYDWGGGLIWLAPTEEPADGGAEVIRKALAEVGGHATLVRGADNVKSQVSVFHPQQLALASLTRQIKDAFDPRNILNPGRMGKDS